MKKRIFILVFIFTTGLAQAMTMYVSHSTPILLFSSPKTTSTVVTQIPTGAEVNLLKTNLENGFSYIETTSKEKGWVQTNFLLSHPAKQATSLWHRVLQHLTFWHSAGPIKGTPLAIQLPSGTSSKMSLEQQVLKLNSQVKALKKHQRGDWFWFVWGALIALIGAWVGAWLSHRKRSRSLFR
jgi:uncharacterized protein YgiM (DUF1202 family)